METEQAREWRWLIFLLAALESFLFGGLIFGWGSLVFILKQEGVFAHLCVHDTSNTSHVKNDLNVSLTKLSPNKSDVITASTNHTIGITPGDDDGSFMTSDRVVTCVGQDDMLSLCYSVSSGFYFVGTGVFGFVAFKFGTRNCRLVGWVCFTVGSLLVAFTSPDHPWLLFGGLAPLTYGGVALIVTNIQIGTLFDTWASTVIAAVGGIFDSSSVMMLFVKFAHENGFKRRDFFLVLCGLHVLTLVSTLVLMPRTHFTWKTEQHCITAKVKGNGSPHNGQTQASNDLQSREDENHHETLLNGSEHTQKETSAEGKEEDHHTPTTLTTTTTKPEKEKEEEEGVEKAAEGLVPSLKDCLLSSWFIMEVFWLCLLQLRFTFFLAAFNPWLTSLFDSEEEVSRYTNVSMYCMMAGLPISLLCGATFDFFKYVFAKRTVGTRRHKYPAITMLFLVSGLGVLFSVCVLVTTRSAVFMACVLSAVLRSSIYGVDSNLIALLFPPRYLTAMFGVCDLVGGAVSILQYAFVVWCQASGFPLVNSVMLALVAVTFIHPLVHLYRTRRADEHTHTVEAISLKQDLAPDTAIY